MGTAGPIKPDRIILFDGVCNLCNSSVQFIIRRDPTSKYSFAALQSAFGISQMQKYNLAPGMLNSVVLIEDGQLYQRSTAALKIARNLSGLWPAMYVFIMVPPFIRNAVYDLIARNRYRLFGRREECMIPTPELRSRFIAGGS